MKPYKVKNSDGTWSIYNVPLVETGIEYPLSTGPHTFTESELQAAVEAYLTDPAVKAPRLKLGHTSDFNFNNGDAEPAFGTAENLRMSENQQAVIGDYTGVPEWLANIMPTAYPSRSIDALGGVTTATGKQHDMVITAVCALGIYWPGCSVLDDLPKWFGTEVPEGAVIEDIAASGGDMGLFKRNKIEAAVDTTKVRRSFYQSMGQIHPYWWIRAERYGDDEGMYLIVEDDAAGEGDPDLYKIPVSVSDDNVEFGEPKPVTVAYPAKKKVAASAIAAGMQVADPAILVHASRAETSPEEPQPQEGGETQVDTKDLAKRLGLPEDATEEQIDQKLNELRQGQPDSKTVDAGETSPAGQTGTGEPGMEMNDDSTHGPKPEQGPVGGAPTAGGPVVIPPPDELQAKLQSGELVILDSGTLAHIKAGADKAIEHDNERITARNRSLVIQAVKDGIIPGARQSHWETLAAADYEGTKTMLEAMPKNLIPVNEIGVSAGSEEITANAGGEGLPAEWFPSLRQPATVGQVTKAKEA
jgi:hypothetical protein